MPKIAGGRKKAVTPKRVQKICVIKEAAATSLSGIFDTYKKLCDWEFLPKVHFPLLPHIAERACTMAGDTALRGAFLECALLR